MMTGPDGFDGFEDDVVEPDPVVDGVCRVPHAAATSSEIARVSRGMVRIMGFRSLRMEPSAGSPGVMAVAASASRRSRDRIGAWRSLAWS
jgi:hypothetical protein